jgi:hypothetical protein
VRGICSLLISASSCFGWVTTVPDVVKEITRTISLPGNGRVSLETYKGKILVTTWDRPEIEIVARVEADGSAAESVRATDVRIGSRDGTVSIRSDYSRASTVSVAGPEAETGSLPFVNYTIRMPRTASLSIKDYTSTIDVANLKSDLTLNTYQGTAEISGLRGGLQLETYKGNVRVRFSRLARRSRIQTYQGRVRIDLPKDARVELEPQIGVFGDLQTDTCMHASGGTPLELRTFRGTFRVRGT